MSVTLSYSAFCEYLGAPLHNKVWSWCAISRDKRLVLLSVWEDGIEDGRYIIPTEPPTEERRKTPGRTELTSVLNELIENGYAVYGIQCKAKDIHAIPRSRKSFIKSELLDMRVRREGNNYIGQIVGRIPPEVILSRGSQAAWIASTAINDIGQDEVGNPDPEYRMRMSGSYVRDAKVRELVLKRAGGLCEECNEPGFLKPGGKRYLETHHVISLSEQGADKLHNVIALCATDHRRAHYAENWIELQDRFLAKLSNYKTETEN
jgi:5-methylcytosine-specific restriction enzyme A